MPELPDVEVFKRYLDSTALHKTIEDVQVHSASVLKEISSGKFRDAVKGKTLSSSRRHGKNLFVQLGNQDGWIVMHFGMTGFLKYFQELEDDSSHDRIRFDLTNGYHLAFDSQRKLGKVQLIEQIDSYLAEHDLGPDALDSDFGFEEFKQGLKGRSGSIKSTLMNQKIVAGIGNVYADEILYQASILPQRPVGSLSDRELKDIYHSMRNVLKTAINHKANPDEFPKNYITAHRKEGVQCPGCSGKVHKEKISGRSSYFCPSCQN